MKIEVVSNLCEILWWVFIVCLKCVFDGNNKKYFFSAQENYNEVVHNLGYYPDIVSVQTNLTDGYMSDGQGKLNDHII